MRTLRFLAGVLILRAAITLLHLPLHAVGNHYLHLH